ncbi:CPBP family intramembrane metalloprotease [Aliifodinibius sp. S!AR15-10]|uniref:CPBP family intramembrane glutamic endopeptidase n=1 Tax=Aliifodinibius sp. S!AR15-10 TaxID=2950437 RepID=UPI002858ED2F|nr:CPBP family intramembrane glutamic endopeptidase [Aliifodinibius sp. S!AR15-10]MDR8389644.1 CPBP family intramembrane metalloprotease [Aliifodinibius sp. S!AR15-10]
MKEEIDANNQQEINSELPGNLLVLSVISALVYVVVGWLIFYFFRDMGVESAFDHGFSVSTQLAIGTGSGIVGAGIISYLMDRPPISGVLDDFYIVRILSNTRLGLFDRTQLSLFAGAGEEFLFRGAMQPLLGIWVTSLIFVGLHGYFKFQKLGHIAFGVMMFGLSMGLGYVYEYAGLIAAMTAHAIYDMIMLYQVTKKLTD